MTLLRSLLTSVVFVAVAASAPAAARPADCKLVVNGKTYITGVCEFTAQSGGSFSISGNDYFAIVTVSGNTADANWNADPKSTHAQAPLGALTRKAGCWVSRTVEICARNLPPAKLAAATANRPDGVMIYPDTPGASSSCVGARDGRWEAGVALVLRNCRLPGDKVYVRAGGAILIDKRPGLCIDAQQAPGARAARLVLAACDRASTQWQSDADSLNAQPVRSANGLCWNIPALADQNAKFPFEAFAVPCSPDTAKNQKFFFAKD